MKQKIKRELIEKKIQEDREEWERQQYQRLKTKFEGAKSNEI